MAKDKAGNSIKTANQTVFNSLKPRAINFSDSIGGSDASDYFRVRLKSRTSVELSLTGLKQDANLQLLQKSGKVIKQSNKKGKSNETLNITLDSGVYYFHIVGTSKETDYTLRATGNRDNGGDKVDSATPVTVNDGKTVFKDYIGPSDKADVYKFTTSNSGPQQIKLTMSGLKADANLALLGSDGEPITSSQKPGTARETITQTLMPDTTYFMKVSAGRKQPGTPYKLLSNLGDVPDRAGNARDRAAAKFLQLPALGDSFSTLVTELLNKEDVDVFRIVGPNEPTSIDLKLTGLSEDADLYLYEEGNPVAIATSDQGGTRNEAINGVILEPGVNYYIEVAPYAPSKYTFFTLSARTQVGINDSAGNTPDDARNIDDDPVWRAGTPGVSQGPLDPTQYADAVGSFDKNDYYVFTLNQRSSLRLKADLTSGSAKLQLIGDDGTTVLESVLGTTSSQPKVQGVFPEGTYYIRVSSPNDDSTARAEYKLNLAATSVESDPAFVKDIRLGPESSGVPGAMVEMGGLLYFAADDGDGVQLWRTDGTGVDGSLTGSKDGDGTEKLTNQAFTSLENLTVASIGGSDVLFFTAGTANYGTELWRWDAVNGASLVKDIAVGTGSSGIGTTTGIVAVGDRVYFDAIEQGSGTSLNVELWYSDGTAAGTQSLELVPGEFFGSFPRDLININDKAYFVASNGSSERLFTIDTSGGTVTALEVAGQEGLSNFGNLTNVKGTLYFTASGAAEGGSDRGNEIWRISSTGKPEAVADIVAGSAGATDISNLSVLGDSLFFAANSGSAGTELWEMKIDPSTKATTVEIAADINVTAANAGSNPQQLTVVDGKLFFLADDGINGQGLWRYDPAAAVGQRTSLVQYDDGGTLRDVAASGGVSLNPSAGSLISVGDFLYFKANRVATGDELWRVSPSLNNGNAEELDLLAGNSSSSPSDFTEVNGRLFFRATDEGDTDESVGRELWVVGLAENP